MSEDWQPAATDWQFAIERLGNPIAAGECLARFRDHFAAAIGPKSVSNNWGARFRNWVRDYAERLASGQRQLPMFGTVKGGKSAAIATTAAAAIEGKIYIAPLTHEAQWDAWRRHRGGKSLPTDKAGGWWVDSEWPAGSDVAPEAKRQNG